MPIGNGTRPHGAIRSSLAESNEHDEDIVAKRTTEVPSNLQMRATYDANDNPVYVGYAARALAEGTDGWLLQYYEYDGNNNATSRTIAYGNWTNRASETYG